MAEIPDQALAQLLPALDEAARAQQQTVERFVPPRPGLLEQVGSRRHQFVLGRRGVGKSTLLRTVEARALKNGSATAFVDLETLRGIAYPDVLVHLLVAILAALRKRIKTVATLQDPKRALALLIVRRRLRKLEKRLARLLGEPQVVRKTVTKLRQTSAGAGGDLGGGVRMPDLPVAINLSARRHKTTEETESIEADFEQSKMDGLYAAAYAVRAELIRAAAELESHSCTIILDDFYHVRTDDQPYVLGYLHQVVKNIDIFLKVGAVSHRLVPFVEGDPPTGVQIGHDAGEVSLDLTLEQFSAAQAFLESVLAGILSPLDITLDDLVTDGGRTRLVLASGGVARDYLNLVAQALRVANERESRPSRPHNKITAEDVNSVSQHLQEQKQTDLQRDAGPNADALRERFSDLVAFCLDHNDTNVFVVETNLLRETEWGAEVEALADLRFVHRIGPVSIQSSTYRGRQFTAFTLDLSSYTGTRSERIRQIEFWTTKGREQLRRVGLIYSADERADASSSVAPSRPPVDWEQDPLPGIEG